ncbi:Athe_2463 domain-containing protein [Cohnella luojiensis]|uniref:PKD domain-containing protein n=1 Tax=Cohnella luojiensis TaxID=652876 RepID=A0A4Y8M4E6_9BACL|nr:hypothetical protein [Cohnella luojiensis]TFE27855.1 hypothetical protein E2980_08720 [Cohnella luojiensis]
MRRRMRRKAITFSILITFLVSLLPMYPIEVSAALSAKDVCEKTYAWVTPPPGFPKCSDLKNGNSWPFNQYLFDKLGVIAYVKMDENKNPVLESISENRAGNGFKRGWRDPANGNVYSDGETTGYGGKHPAFPVGSPYGEYRYLGYDRAGTLYSNTFFINDSKTGTDPNTRYWVYKPWTSTLLNGRTDKPIKMSPLLSKGFDADDTDVIYARGTVVVNSVKKIIKSDDVTIQKAALLNGSSTPPDTKHNLFDYMYVEQDPTVWAPGMGRMWHKKPDGAIWYQTFPIAKTEGKDKPGLDSKIVITGPNKSDGKIQTDANVLGNSFTYSMDLTGDLKDNAYYNDQYLKAKWYTRYDLKEWNLKLEAAYPGKSLYTVGTYSSLSNGQVTLSNEGEIATIKDVKFKVNNKLNKGDEIELILTATAQYQSTNNEFDQNVYRTKIVIGEKPIPIPPPQGPPPEPVDETPPLVCKPNIPTQAFDIVEFPASDGTDLSRIDTRIVTVNGVSVDPDLFFSGGYVFGDDADGFATVTMKWTPKPGEDKNGADMCDTYRIVNVHDTKPRAQFKLFGGSFKENRKMSIDNTSRDPNANDPYVQATYPIVSSSWSWEPLNGSSDADRRMRVDTPDHKEFLYKKPGEYQVSLTVTNALGRTSEPYVLNFTVLNDYAPAVIMTPYSSQIARGEGVTLFYDAVSTDGDIITNQNFKIYYDKDFNETYTELVDSFSGPRSEYTPLNAKLGKYRIVATVDEDFGQETFPEFITASDKRQTITQMEFEIDNYLPYSDLYTDIPSIRPDVDTFFLLDKNLAQSKIDYVKGNGVTISNQLRLEGINPQVNVWDMHTYTWSNPASTTVNTGSYPPNTYYYCSSGYCGTLNRTSASDNGYYYDYGQYVSVVDVPGHEETRYRDELWCTGTADSGIVYDHPGGCNGGNNGGASSHSYYKPVPYQVWVPTTYRNEWDPDVRWVSNWYGSYSGTIYKDVRQPYTNPYVRTTSAKYLIYISDGIINELADFNNARSQSDAKVIVIGNASIKTQVPNEFFILNSGQPIVTLIQSAIDYIASFNSATASQLVLTNENFQLLTTDDDVEHDPISQKQTMYVHNENYFDNPTGHAAFALRNTDPPSWTTESLRTSFALTGEYKISRRIKDQPSVDPLFAKYSYYSNESTTIVRVHRKPIALAALDWTYDTNCICYQTSWVDQSYDLDHNVSDPIKRGIADRKIKYRLNGEWFYKTPDKLEPGTYHLEYLVKDVEGVWSDPFILDFTLAATPPPQLKAKLTSADPYFTLAGGVPASENLIAYELWTRFPLSVGLQFSMGSYINKTVPYFTGTKSGSNIDWTDVLTPIPATTPDGSYTYRIQANGSNATSAYKDFAVKVLTPINLVPDIRKADGHTTDTIVVGYPFTIAADTTEYPNQVTLVAFKGKSFQRSLTLNGTVSSTTGKGSKQWSASFTPLGVIPDGTYTFEWTARTLNGNTEIRTLQVQLINNTPPFGDFKRYTYDPADTAMPIYEGDLLHIRSIGVGDNEHDPLTLRYELMDPSGTKRFDSTLNSLYPYASAGPDYQLPSGPTAVGTWTIRQTISDGKAAPVVRTQSMSVRPLGIQGYVKHTDAWERNRLLYNEKHSSAQRPAHWFWAGEAFVLEATVTDTGASGTKPISVKSVATPELQKSLAAANPQAILWKGLLREADASVSFKDLPQGNYSFVFSVTFNNGITKTSIVPIRLQDTVDNYVQVHRLQ